MLKAVYPKGSPEAKQFNRYWTQTHKDIVKQNAFLQANPNAKSDDIATLVAVWGACIALNINEDRMLWVIKNYEKRNEFMRAELTEVLKDANWPKLAKTLYQDSKEIRLILDPN